MLMMMVNMLCLLLLWVNPCWMYVNDDGEYVVFVNDNIGKSLYWNL